MDRKTWKILLSSADDAASEDSYQDSLLTFDEDDIRAYRNDENVMEFSSGQEDGPFKSNEGVGTPALPLREIPPNPAPQAAQ